MDRVSTKHGEKSVKQAELLAWVVRLMTVNVHFEWNQPLDIIT
jgi:hypothetical protein